MKKKFTVALITLMLSLSNISNITCVKAEEHNPAFSIADDYVIIDYVKYNLENNKILYDGLEYKLIDHNLFLAYDSEGNANVMSLPLEENRIKDQDRIEELNNLTGVSNGTLRAIPSSTVNLPYTRQLGESQSSVISPIVNVNVPGSTYYRVLSLKVTGLAWNARKIFDVRGIYGDVAGNWYDLPSFLSHDFGKNSTVKWQNFSSTRYAQLIFASLYQETGYTYTINKSTF